MLPAPSQARLLLNNLIFIEAQMDSPVIYNYFDYRTFLDDLYKYKKNISKHFSYRSFSKKAGFVASNFLKLVTTGRRNLTSQSIGKVAKGFGLTKQERDFFENLVFMNQAGSHDEKNYYYQKMMISKGFTRLHKLEKEKYEYFSKWYYPAIREVLTLGKRNYSPKQIASMLKPQITPIEVQGAVKLLEKLKLVKKDSSGRWEKSDMAIGTEREVQSLTITKYHKEMLKRSADALDILPADQRDISAVTLSIKRKKMEDLKKILNKCRQELIDLACDDKKSDQVVQVNFQAFFLSKEVK